MISSCTRLSFILLKPQSQELFLVLIIIVIISISWSGVTQEETHTHLLNGIKDWILVRIQSSSLCFIETIVETWVVCVCGFWQNYYLLGHHRAIVLRWSLKVNDSLENLGFQYHNDNFQRLYSLPIDIWETVEVGKREGKGHCFLGISNGKPCCVRYLDEGITALL